MVTVLSVVSDGIQRFYWKRALLLACCSLGAGVAPWWFRKISLRFRKFRAAVNMVPNEFIIFLFVQEGCMETTSLEAEDLLHIVLAIGWDHWSQYLIYIFCLLIKFSFQLSAFFSLLQKNKGSGVSTQAKRNPLVKREYFTCLSLQTAY